MAMRSRTRSVALGLVLLTVGPLAAAQAPAQAEPPAAVHDRAEQPIRNGSASQVRNGDIYGYQLMTERERAEFRERIRAAATEQEREQIRVDHHAQMQARAADRGVTLAGPKISNRFGQSSSSGDGGRGTK
jgi:hypothetical protein